jgi:hypothetical protein
MTGTDLDSLAKGLVEGRVSRGRALKLFGAGLAATAFAGLTARTATAAPNTCVTCVCGTGNPCNPKSTTCREVKAFPAEETCEQACAKKGQKLCSAGNAFHCPRGCGAITCDF